MRTLKALLACGIISSVMYVATDIIASLSWDAYSYTSQMVSELGAIGAPTRPAWIAMSMVYNPLVFAFGMGVWKVARSRSLRVSGAMLMAYSVVSFAGPFVPMHQRGSATSLTDVLHVVCTAGIVLTTLAFIAFGSAAAGKGFRVYSVATILAILAGGALAGLAGAEMAAGGSTPFFGVLERVNIYAEMLWILVLGVVLLRRAGEARQPGAESVARAALVGGR